jgi:hypothetical protein
MFMWIKNILFTYELKSAFWPQGGNTSHNFHCSGGLHLSSEMHENIIEILFNFYK